MFQLLKELKKKDRKNEKDIKNLKDGMENHREILEKIEEKLDV